MARIMLASAFALGAVLAASHVVSAAEPDRALSGFTMTLGGKGTSTEAATATDDTELTHGYRGGYRGYYGGYRGYYGGFGGYYGGYRGYYGRGWGYGGWGGYGYASYYSYSPVYYRSYYYRPYCYRPYVNYYGGYGYGGFGGGIYFGINGTADDANAPAVTLNLAVAKNPIAMSEPSRSNDLQGGFRYDGGPANPVPQVKPDAEPRTPTASASPGLPVSFKKETKPANTYKYKAYGEK